MMHDFAQFMARVGATGRDVAQATGLTEATVSRIRHGKIRNPRWDVVQRLIAWADVEARRLGLPERERLRWDPLAASRRRMRKRAAS